MARYFIKLSYKGTAYHGWQIQENANTVQTELNQALQLVLRASVQTTGAGRTDTGVHAHEFFAHFDWDMPIADAKAIQGKLNKILPHDIAIQSIIEVSPGTHARFDATQRTYKYFVCQTKNPFFKDYALMTSYQLDMEKMNQAAAELLHVQDFTSFAKLHSDNKTNLCKVSRAEWTYEHSNSMLVFTISADRFLRNMVRSVVGTLLDVGRGKLSLSQFQQVIQAKNRSSASTSAPAQGLFLWHVHYPFIVE